MENSNITWPLNTTLYDIATLMTLQNDPENAHGERFPFSIFPKSSLKMFEDDWAYLSDLSEKTFYYIKCELFKILLWLVLYI